MKTQSLKFFQKLRHIVSDLVLLYKNFLHWNISKVIIAAWTFLLGIILSLPLIIFLVLLGIIDPIDWTAILGNIVLGQTVDYDVVGGILLHPFFVFFEALLLVLIFLAMILGSSYGLVLRTHLYLGYKDGKKLPYFKNLYFDRKTIFQYIRVFFLVLGYIIIPVIVLLVYLLLLNVFFPGVIYGQENIFSKVLFIIIPSIVALVSFFYISFRLSFSYIILLEKNKSDKSFSAKKTVHTSRKITRGLIILPFLGVIFLYGLVITPFNIVEETINGNASDAKLYLGYKTGQISIETQESQEIYNILKEQFDQKTDNEVVEDIVWLGRMNMIFVIISFLLISGTLEMVAVSFYMNFLKKNEKKSLFSALTQRFFKKKNKEL